MHDLIIVGDFIERNIVMKAAIPVLVSITVISMLFCLGCEEQPQTEPAVEETIAQPAEESTVEQVETEIGHASEMVEEETDAQLIAQAEEEMAEMLAEAKAKADQEKAQIEKEIEESLPQAPQPVPVAPEDDVAVTINGIVVNEAQVNARVEKEIASILARSQGRPMPDGYAEQMKERLHDRMVTNIVTETLIDQEIEKQGLVITDEQVDAKIAQIAVEQKLTVDDIKQLLESGGRNFDDFKDQTKYKLAVLELAEAQGLGSLDVNETDARHFYEENKARFENPEQVQASHILIKPDTSDPNADPVQADADARGKAEVLLQQIKTGKDFAELAKEHSSCSSAAKGGDLGFAAKEAWVKPFSDAAFALQPGQVSDVVKTRFGYHIIKVTDRKEAGKTSFDEVKNEIIGRLKMQKEGTIGAKYIGDLRQRSEVVYPEGKEPKMPPPRARQPR